MTHAQPAVCSKNLKDCEIEKKWRHFLLVHGSLWTDLNNFKKLSHQSTNMSEVKPLYELCLLALNNLAIDESVVGVEEAVKVVEESVEGVEEKAKEANDANKLMADSGKEVKVSSYVF